MKLNLNTQMKLEEPLAINVYSTINNPDELTTSQNTSFLHSLALIDALLRMKSLQTDRHNFISLIKNEYKNNDTQLSIIHEFEYNYSAHKAIWWYFHKCFLYNILNKSLQIQNIDLLFFLRFIINDIYRQLKTSQCQSAVRVYHGQLISEDELNIFQPLDGKFLSNSSFLLTSIDRKKMIKCLNNANVSEGLHRVLFVIDADSGTIKSKPFADLKEFVDENEVMFMIGCIFCLKDIRKDDEHDQIWIIRVELCDENDQNLRAILDQMKKQYEHVNGEVNLLSFGDALSQMKKYDLAEKIYHRVLAELSSNDPLLGDLYYSFGLLNYHKDDYNSSLQWFKKALKIRIESPLSNYINISKINNWIGKTYEKNDNLHKALKYYNKVVELYTEKRAEREAVMADIYNNIATIYYKQKQYSEALEFYQKSLYVNERYPSPDKSNVVEIHNSIGIVYYCLSQYTHAMDSHRDALKILLANRPSNYLSLAKTYRFIGIIQERQDLLARALTHYQKAATNYRELLPAEHPDLIEIEQSIKRVLSRLNK
jgi:tetratricopeptide (TPR) repeat protein